MKPVHGTRVPILPFFIFLFLFAKTDIPADPAPPDRNDTATWRQIDSLDHLGLTASALAAVENLYQSAKKNADPDQVVRALLYRARLESKKEEDAEIKTIGRFEGEIAEAKAPLAQILHSITAELYWKYYHKNRWRIAGRTLMVDSVPGDIASWDPSRIVTVIIRHYEASLQDADTLKTMSLSAFRELVLDTGCCDNRRPTLYDFLAHRAVDFLMSSENDLHKPGFVIHRDSGSVYFRNYGRFAQLPLATRDSLSFKFRALGILQEIISFHEKDGNIEALVDADLKRLDFVRSCSTLENREQFYLSALNTLRDKFRNNPAASEVLYKIALWYSGMGDTYKPGSDTSGRWMKKRAVEVCDSAIARYGDAFGARQCSALRSGLLTKRVSFEVESYAIPDKPSCGLLSWSNSEKMAFRIVPLPDSIDFQDRRWSYGVFRNSVFPLLKTHAPLARWIVALPASGDHQTHSIEIALPPLACGRYALFACTDSTFTDTNSALAGGIFRVSAITYLAQTQKDRSLELYVRDRETGKAIQHAVVKKVVLNHNWPRDKTTTETLWIDTTDNEGRAVFPADTGKRRWSSNLTFEIVDGKDHILGDEVLWGEWVNKHDTGSIKIKTVFFTDRSLYRPGQTIYFKGIVLQRDGDTDAIVPHCKNRVTLYDANSQPVDSLDLTTDDYGAMSGSFIAPLSGLRGVMRIKSELPGEADVSVEEYKRPKFEVTLNPVKGQFRLNTVVTMTGQAKAYAGSPIDHAAIKYWVSRTERRPWWDTWWIPDHSTRAVDIAHDSIATDDTGGFRITFTAVPDKAIPESGNPAFVYTINVDVTNAGGETRSAAASVIIGSTALDLFVALPRNVDKLHDTAFPIKTLNRSGQEVHASGAIRIFHLRGPDRAVRNRYWRRPDTSVMSEPEFRKTFPSLPYGGEDSFVNWPKETMVEGTTFDTRTDSMLVLRKAVDWPQGMYVVEASATDTFGREVTSKQYFLLYSSKERSAAAPLADLFIPVRQSGEPGDKAVFIVGSGYKNVEGLLEVVHRGERVRKEWLAVSNSQKLVEIPIENSYRGDFEVRFTFMKNGRSYSHDCTVKVPWSNKALHLSFETFRDKLLPGNTEEWRIKIRGPKGERVAAEMAAAMYDASLDAIRGHTWTFETNRFTTIMPWWNYCAPFGHEQPILVRSVNPRTPVRCYPSLNWFDNASSDNANRDRLAAGGAVGGPDDMSKPIADEGYGGGEKLALIAGRSRVGGAVSPESDSARGSPSFAQGEANLSSVHPRANLDETAFFYPQLHTNDSGEVVVSFTVPDALTRWKLLGLAHTRDLKFGLIEKRLVTQKPLMVMPNLPRFLREKDRIAVSATIVNLSDSGVAGSARLMLFDALSMKPLDSAFDNYRADRNFTIAKGRSSSSAWEIRVPEGIGPVVVRIVAGAGDVSDGEDNMLPVVANRALVTEALPLPVRGAQTKHFTFVKLLSQNNGSPTLRNHRLTLEFARNPAWYAVQALPCLMENGDECVERIFSHFYATTIAAFIANASPKIKAVFDAWKSQGADALLSNLEKNRELKDALVEETPWVLDGKDETERKHRIGVLFDLNRMSYEKFASLDKLQRMQTRETGAWPWFPGMPPDRFVTQYIITGLGRLRHLSMFAYDPSEKLFHGQDEQSRNVHWMVERGLNYLDRRIREDYDQVLDDGHPDSNNLTCQQIQYLYARSYFTDVTFTDSNLIAFNYYLQQSKRYWMRNNRYLEGMIALALHRTGDTVVPNQIIRSLRENALHNDEMGMYWKEMTEGWYWYAAPVEAQALSIEAFDEVAHDGAAVEEMKLWLLKSKQTYDWRTSKATAEACYALLLRGIDLLSTHNDVSVTLGRVHVDPARLPHDSVEAGTGYFTTSWNASEIKPDMGRLTVTRTGSGLSWGAVYWQYFEDLDKITSSATPLALSRRLFIKRNGDRGPWLDPLSGEEKIRVGDKVTVRIELTVDRDLEYVHMKDQRAAGFEPLEALSGHRRQDGLGYYESTGDLATHFFFPNIRKGRYVLEYDLIAAHQGDFSTGITSIQCMYAPEFAAHSEGMRVKVGKNNN